MPVPQTGLSTAPFRLKSARNPCIFTETTKDTFCHRLSTGDFFEEWNEITLTTHIRKFEELTALGPVSC